MAAALVPEVFPSYSHMQLADIVQHIKDHTTNGVCADTVMEAMPFGATFLDGPDDDETDRCVRNLKVNWSEIGNPVGLVDCDKHFIMCTIDIIYRVGGDTSLGSPTISLGCKYAQMSDNHRGKCYITDLNNQKVFIEVHQKQALVDALKAMSVPFQAHSNGQILTHPGENHSLSRIVLWFALMKANISCVSVWGCGGKVQLPVWMEAFDQFIVKQEDVPALLDLGTNLAPVQQLINGVLEPVFTTLAVDTGSLGAVSLEEHPAKVHNYNVLGAEAKGFGTVTIINRQYEKGRTTNSKKHGNTGLTVGRYPGDANSPGLVCWDIYHSTLVHNIKSVKGGCNWSAQIGSMEVWKRSVDRIGVAIDVVDAIPAKELCQTRLEKTLFVKADQWTTGYLDIAGGSHQFSSMFYNHPALQMPKDIGHALAEILPRAQEIFPDPDSEDEDDEDQPAHEWLGSYIRIGPPVSKSRFIHQADMYFALINMSKESKIYSSRNADVPHLRQQEMLVSLLNDIGYAIHRGWTSLCAKTWDPVFCGDETKGVQATIDWQHTNPSMEMVTAGHNARMAAYDPEDHMFTTAFVDELSAHAHLNPLHAGTPHPSEAAIAEAPIIPNALERQVIAQLKMPFHTAQGKFYVMHLTGGRSQFSAATKKGVARKLTEAHLGNLFLTQFVNNPVGGAEEEVQQIDMADNDISLEQANQGFVAFYHELDDTDQVQMDHIMRCVKIYPVQRGARHALRLETNGVAKSNTHKAQLWWWVFQQWKEEGVNWDAVLNLVQAVADPHEQGNPLIPAAAELPQGAEPSFVVAPYAAPGAAPVVPAPVVPAPVQSNQPTRRNQSRRNQGRGTQQSSASSSSSVNNGDHLRAMARKKEAARRNDDDDDDDDDDDTDGSGASTTKWQGEPKASRKEVVHQPIDEWLEAMGITLNSEGVVVSSEDEEEEETMSV